jgi:hypothetical protein
LVHGQATTRNAPSNPCHGLSYNELRLLKKNDLVRAFEAEGIPYKKHWTKAVMVNAYLEGLTEKNHPPEIIQIDDKETLDNLLDTKIVPMEIVSAATQTYPVAHVQEVVATIPKPSAVMVSALVSNEGESNRDDHKLFDLKVKGGAVRRIVAEKELQAMANGIARIPAAFPHSSAKKFLVSEKKIRKSELASASTDLFGSKHIESDSPSHSISKLAFDDESNRMEIDSPTPFVLLPKDSTVASIASKLSPTKLSVNQPAALVERIDYDSKKQNVACTLLSQETPILPFVPRLGLARSADDNVLRPTNLSPITKWSSSKVQPIPPFGGTSANEAAKLATSSAVSKPSLKDRNARAAQIKEEVRLLQSS